LFTAFANLSSILYLSFARQIPFFLLLFPFGFVNIADFGGF